MAQFLSLVLLAVVFLAIYALLRERAARKFDKKPPVQWNWLAVIAGCVLVAILAELVL
jgi:threonine/homoserine/homoserine lactone efflux protein